MSGPTRLRIEAIVTGIKNFGYVCFVRKLCSVQSIHTELAKLYSQKVISPWCSPPISGDESSIHQAFLVRGSGIKAGPRRLY